MSDSPPSGAPSDPKANDFKSIQLSRIVGLHPCLELLYAELSIPPFRQVPSDTLAACDIADLLELHPLRVSTTDKRLRCSGNVLMYQLALRLLSDNHPVPCIVEPLLPEKRLIERAIKELVYGTACLGAHFSDIKIIARIAKQALDAGHITINNHSVESLITKLFRVDKRQLKSALSHSDTQLEMGDISQSGTETSTERTDASCDGEPDAP